MKEEMSMEYQFIVGVAPAEVHARVNELAAQGWSIQKTYGIPDCSGGRAHLHCVWMYRVVNSHRESLIAAFDQE
jgi:hypothetical protein